MNTRQKLLTAIEQLPDEKLASLLELAIALKAEQAPTHKPSLDRRAFLKLPLEERNASLVTQAALIADSFQPGTEQMEWAEDYVEDQNWDEE
ncbi:MAG TPA: hypothetical protein V6C63_01675 [Allocoleopsis sp.]